MAEPPHLEPLVAALSKLAPRQRALLLALAEPKSVGPDWYGVSDAAFAVAKTRAIESLASHLAIPGEEALSLLRQHLQLVRAGLLKQQQNLAATPKERAKDLFFRVGFAVLVAVAAVLYWANESDGLLRQLPSWLTGFFSSAR